jgi:hypothetical protein
MTAPIQIADRGESEVNAERIVNNVMGRVAEDIGLNNSAEILELRDRALKSRSDAIRLGEVTAENSPTLPPVRRSSGDLIEDKVPPALFARKMANSNSIGTHPIAMNTALQALRFAIKNPTTDYNEGPSTAGSSAPHNYVRSTVISKTRQLPRVQPTIDPVEYEARSQKLKSQNKFSRGLAEPTDAQSTRLKARDKTLKQIEEVLDSLNANTKELVSSDGRNNSLQSMRNFARPHTGISSLVQMVNDVVQELGV